MLGTGLKFKFSQLGYYEKIGHVYRLCPTPVLNIIIPSVTTSLSILDVVVPYKDATPLIILGIPAIYSSAGDISHN